MTNILDDLSVKTLPVVESNRGEYVDEEWVFETFAEAAAEIKRLRELNDKAGKVLAIAAAALGTLSISTYSGSHIASNALIQMGNIAAD